MTDYLRQNNVQGAMSLGIAGAIVGYCYSFGWSALSGIGLVMSAGVGAYALFKLAELCISLKALADTCNDTACQVNKELIVEVKQTIQKANDLADKLEGVLDAVSDDMLPQAQKTLTNIQDMTDEANKAVEQASDKMDDMLSGQMVIQLGTASVHTNSHAHAHAKKVKLH